jgi:murein DD-endopeptidase MepM/ murein hydrolase activator NlpD
VSLHVIATAMVASVLVATQAPSAIQITSRARAVQPGELVLLTIEGPTPLQIARVRAFSRELRPYTVDDTRWQVLVGIDLDVRPGIHAVSIEPGPPNEGSVITHNLVVRGKAFPTRRLTVDEAFVNPPATVTRRIEEEAEALNRLWASSAATRAWSGPFVRPVPGPANSRFGSRSILNGQARSPHGGADFASPSGTPLRAPNAGRVMLAAHLYYTGGTIVVDHGLGLVSLFAHLSRLDVAEGQSVQRGAIIGAVGATGRVTGAHLHWTVRANGARVDPLSLLEVLGS